MIDAADHEPDPVEIPITDELDLHQFKPSDLAALLPEYLRECRKKGILEVRVVHGKGTGALRQGVVKLLDRLDCVIGHRPGDAGSGSWGATWATLHPWGYCQDDSDG
jgi:DNA-nicking Smr family endonuclease